MAGAIKWKIEVLNLNQFKRKLKPAHELYGGPWKTAMESLATDLGQRAMAAAPVRTGAMRASIVARAAATSVPLSLRVKARAKSSRGFPYPRALEFAPKFRHIRWLRDAVYQATGMIRKHLDTAARAIERKWA